MTSELARIYGSQRIGATRATIEIQGETDLMWSSVGHSLSLLIGAEEHA